jgi:hypothetical protein
MRIFTIICLLLVATAFGQSLAHALEFPGKLRLDEAAYRTVQQIDYPGFTIGGIAEPLSILALGALLYLTPCSWGLTGGKASPMTSIADEIAGLAVTRNMFILLQQATERGGVPLTATGNLSRAVVAEMRELIEWSGYDQADALQPPQVINEPDFLPLDRMK